MPTSEDAVRAGVDKIQTQVRIATCLLTHTIDECETTPTPAAATPPASTVTPAATPAHAAQVAWTTQPLAKPVVTIEPTGNTTLAGLPTYFSAGFGAAGLAPGESVTSTVLGHTVTIRPTGAMYTYVFGDGSTYGPTSDTGGPYPTGGVRHTYTKKGDVVTRVDVTLVGQYQADGGAWQTIPGSTTVTGTPQPLTVAILQSRLVH